MLLASIDVGTNSSLLLVTRASEAGRLEIVEERFTTTRLGQGVAASGRLGDDAIARTLATLERYAARVEAHGVDWVGAVGTAALRDAANGQRFLERARQALGCPVEVVSGQREAELMVAGVQGALGALPGRTLLLDIGGGSTELVLARDGRVERLVSLALGAVRLTEAHLGEDPPTGAALDRARAAITRALEPLPRELLTVDRLVGTAGTITTLATMALGLEHYDSDRVNAVELNLTGVRDTLEGLAAAAPEERRRIPGLDPGRADIIVAGVLILEAVMARAARCLRVCDRGVRWGLQQEALQALTS